MPVPDTKPTSLPTASAIAELIGIASNLAQPKTLAGFEPFVFTPAGTMVALTPAKARPLEDFIEQTNQFHDLESFTRYLNEFKRHTTRVFASTSDTGAVFSGVIDYHEAGKDGGPRREAHVVNYPCPSSDAWWAWREKNGQAFSQSTFFEFIDERRRDIIKPDSAEILELIRNFSSKSDVIFSSKITPESGGSVLQYQDEPEQGRPDGKGGFIKAPDELTIEMPLFEGGRRYPLVARLRPRTAGGKLTFTYVLYAVAETIRLAVRDIAADIEAATELKPYFGTRL